MAPLIKLLIALLITLFSFGCTQQKNLSYSQQIEQKTKYYSALSEEEQIKAVTEYWWKVQFIKSPSYNVQKAALESSPRAIEEIENPTKEIQVLAVNKIMKDGSFNIALTKLINTFDEEAQIAAVKHNPQIIQFIPYPSDKVQLEAVKVNPFVIKNIINATEEAKQEAIKRNPRVAKFLR
ncbi:hypothetical protein [Sulfurimonas marina]|uniref:DUF4116 domain-containing protein n=1 Tax=Sulfurimonas marina TaxID=2590551 RepID=A0A7M1AUU7_9BACT|nr:hypothetical protein [Sulfurimonas marina]QOP41189.1 hypothetical protein FJR03_05310 [Sulfurimonas marina]